MPLTTTKQIQVPTPTGVKVIKASVLSSGCLVTSKLVILKRLAALVIFLFAGNACADVRDEAAHIVKKMDFDEKLLKNLKDLHEAFRAKLPAEHDYEREADKVYYKKIDEEFVLIDKVRRQAEKIANTLIPDDDQVWLLQIRLEDLSIKSKERSDAYEITSGLMFGGYRSDPTGTNEIKIPFHKGIDSDIIDFDNPDATAVIKRMDADELRLKKNPTAHASRQDCQPGAGGTRQRA